MKQVRERLYISNADDAGIYLCGIMQGFTHVLSLAPVCLHPQCNFNEFTLCKIYRKSGSGAYNKNSPGCSLDVQKGESSSDSDMSPSELQVVAEDDQNDDKGTIRADEEADHKEQLDNFLALRT
ncbi:hypothetical protein SELMODRAFT_423067 [Selaginella moellendorffii]|uniref:Uncharacterized protein n=1 Tax=Selaginella moellendorffii TaxID=88036 RepID=D8SKG6_SELML|nr:hypothetical protein SELMODRAFT_423067 [Selaginella moellendorffii]